MNRLSLAARRHVYICISIYISIYIYIYIDIHVDMLYTCTYSCWQRRRPTRPNRIASLRMNQTHPTKRGGVVQCAFSKPFCALSHTRFVMSSLDSFFES
jgi:hypothetical protein